MNKTTTIYFKKLIILVLCVSMAVLPAGAGTLNFSQDERDVRSFLSLKDLMTTPHHQEGAIQVDIEGMMENTPFKIKGNLGPLNHALDPELEWPVHLTLEAAGASLMIRGTVNELNNFTGINLDFEFSGSNLAALEDMLGIQLPPVNNFIFTGNVKDIQPLHFELSNLHLVTEESEIKGACTIELLRDRTKISVDLTSPYLDLRELLAKNDTMGKAAENQAAKRTGNDRVFSDRPFELTFLERVDLDFNLSGEKMLLPRFALNNFRLQSTIRDGGFAIEYLTGNIGGGNLTGNFSIKPSEETFMVSLLLDIEQMALHRMLEDMEMDIQGEGMVDILLDFNTQGVSMSQLMAGLDGNAGLVMGEGRIDRNYLGFLGLFRINLISSLVNIVSLPVGTGKREETSVTNCFVMRFDVDGGIAKLNAFILDTPHTTIAADGKIDLSSERLDIYLKPISKEGIGAKGVARFNLSLTELTRAFYLGGTLNSPSISVDTTQTFVTLGRAIGGVVLFGPAGVAAALLSGKIGGASQNLCLEAIEVARKGVEVAEENNGIFHRFGDFLKRLIPFF